MNDKIGTVGISDYAQDALGDVVFAQLPDVGSTIKKEGKIWEKYVISIFCHDFHFMNKKDK